MVDCPSAYNVIVGQPTLNKVDSVISTSLLMMKFITNEGRVGTVKPNQAIARHCYNDRLKISGK